MEIIEKMEKMEILGISKVLKLNLCWSRTYLFFGNPHVICYISKDGWFNKETFGSPFITAACDRCPRFLSGLDQLENFVILLFANL